jgi:hypothetical protein
MADAPQVRYGDGGLEPYSYQPHGDPQQEFSPASHFNEAHMASQKHQQEQKKTILGLRRRNFWILFAITLVIVGATIGGSVGGSVAVRNAEYADARVNRIYVLADFEVGL